MFMNFKTFHQDAATEIVEGGMQKISRLKEAIEQRVQNRSELEPLLSETSSNSVQKQFRELLRSENSRCQLITMKIASLPIGLRRCQFKWEGDWRERHEWLFEQRPRAP
jgi:hypothetical protein